MAQKKKVAEVKEVAVLNPRDVQFKVKATPRVREARAALMRAIVGAKGREIELDGIQDTLEVIGEYLESRGKRDVEKRAALAESARVSAAKAQELLDKQRQITAEHDVEQANKGLAAAKAKLAAVKGK